MGKFIEFLFAISRIISPKNGLQFTMKSKVCSLQGKWCNLPIYICSVFVFVYPLIFFELEAQSFTSYPNKANHRREEDSGILGVKSGNHIGGRLIINLGEYCSEKDARILKLLKKSFEIEKSILAYVKQSHIANSNVLHPQLYSICIFKPAIGFGDNNPMANYVSNVFSRSVFFFDHSKGCDVVEFGNPFIAGYIDFNRIPKACESLYIQDFAEEYRAFLNDSVLSVPQAPGSKRYQGEFYAYCKTVSSEQLPNLPPKN